MNQLGTFILKLGLLFTVLNTSFPINDLFRLWLQICKWHCLINRFRIATVT